MKIDFELSDFAQYLADEAAKKTAPLFRNVSHETKADGTVVSQADRDAEEVMRKLIAINFPEHAVFGEEFANDGKEAEFTWVLDPIDGTAAFLAGRPTFATLVALLHNGKPVLGLIDQPISGERWFAVNGETIFRNKPIYSRACRDVSEAFFATTSPFLFAENELAKIAQISAKTKQTIYGGDCYNYAQLAQGNIDVIVESGLKPYDYLAHVCIIENAGGVITDWHGNPLGLESDGKVVACGDKNLHEKLLKILNS